MRTAFPAEHPTEDEIDQALEESFPASDPPAWTRGIEPRRDDEGSVKVDEAREVRGTRELTRRRPRAAKAGGNKGPKSAFAD